MAVKPRGSQGNISQHAETADEPSVSVAGRRPLSTLKRIDLSTMCEQRLPSGLVALKDNTLRRTPHSADLRVNVKPRLIQSGHTRILRTTDGGVSLEPRSTGGRRVDVSDFALKARVLAELQARSS